MSRRRGRRTRMIPCSCMVEAGSHTSCFNHSFSFSSARPRCEILFFSAIGISAYVWPSYSKHASHPMWMLEPRHVNRHSRTILPKCVGPRAGTILPCLQRQLSSSIREAKSRHSHPSDPETPAPPSPDPHSTQKYIQPGQTYLQSQRAGDGTGPPRDSSRTIFCDTLALALSFPTTLANAAALNK